MLTNEKYLKKVGIALSHPNYARCLEIMKGYGENRWWLSPDPKARAYYQTVEHTKSGLLLLPILSSFQRDLFELLGRPVFTHEFLEEHEQELLKEVEEAWQQGSGVSKQKSQKRLLNFGRERRDHYAE